MLLQKGAHLVGASLQTGEHVPFSRRGIRRRAVLFVVDAVAVSLVSLIGAIRGRQHTSGRQAKFFFALLIGCAFLIHVFWIVTALPDDTGPAAEAVADFHCFALHVLHRVDVGPAVGRVLAPLHVVDLVLAHQRGEERRLSEPVDDLLAHLWDNDLPLALLGETSKVFVIFWATLFPLLLATIGGVKEVDTKLIEMARTYGASRFTIFRRVVLPASVPAIFVGLRLSATTALLLLIAAEMIGANKGIGFQVMNAQYNFQIPLMFAAILLLALLGLAANAVLVLLQRKLCRWSQPGA